MGNATGLNTATRRARPTLRYFGGWLEEWMLQLILVALVIEALAEGAARLGGPTIA